jgi:hypothetical protein
MWEVNPYHGNWMEFNEQVFVFTQKYQYYTLGFDSHDPFNNSINLVGGWTYSECINANPNKSFKRLLSTQPFSPKMVILWFETSINLKL